MAGSVDTESQRMALEWNETYNKEQNKRGADHLR